MLEFIMKQEDRAIGSSSTPAQLQGENLQVSEVHEILLGAPGQVIIELQVPLQGNAQELHLKLQAPPKGLVRHRVAAELLQCLPVLLYVASVTHRLQINGHPHPVRAEELREGRAAQQHASRAFTTGQNTLHGDALTGHQPLKQVTGKPPKRNGPDFVGQRQKRQPLLACSRGTTKAPVNRLRKQCCGLLAQPLVPRRAVHEIVPTCHNVEICMQQESQA
mmetsp:Transcript_17701/g.51665  ORF Transcript_17701/g.51665 Transcript_17701/m.51665 type:complete len:220 (+) Transcript_17701:3553-4212(+)